MKLTKNLIASAILGCFSVQLQANVIDLESLYQKAVENDVLVSTVALRTKTADHAVDVQRANLLPQINAYFAVQGLKDSRELEATFGGTGSAVELGANLTQSLYNPAVKVGVNIAEQNAKSAALLLDKARDALILRTTRAYFNVLRADELIHAEEANIQALEAFLAQTQLRLKLGVASEVDYQEAKAQHDNAIARRIRAQAMRDKHLDALTTLTNQTFTGVEPLDTERFSASLPSSPSYSSWLEHAMTNSIDIQLSLSGIDTAKLQLTRAKSGHLPTVSLIAGVQQGLHGKVKANLPQGGTTEVALNEHLTSADVTVAANMPLYHGGRTTALVEIAKTELDIAYQVQEETRRQVSEQIKNSERGARTAKESLQAYGQSLNSSQAALLAVQKGYEVGARTMTEVLTATGHVYTAQTQVAHARYDFIEQALLLKFVAGELSEDDITNINAGLQSTNRH
ncbi:TolC family outer membrane protein [Thaumasiovibrio subtropicus]|uniref:TolC family outer membrane protein n=1 Tax=Thaumasiovibrio subtropicus TaxID=1891207 RepID=UPI00131AD1DA|nr:TolC family outer membrane protein [Thaumasiovibrio subtropicus]